jgi:hypothetical protein
VRVLEQFWNDYSPISAKKCQNIQKNKLRFEKSWEP